ncbi:MAG: hypothetical protein JXQ23_12695 [Clostridia bacterium]|nr:hypothetical protein [Clostridia bacterium]
MKYFKYSLLFKIWNFLCFCYQNSHYHKLGMALSAISLKSKAHQVMKRYIERTPSSHQARITDGTVHFLTKPFSFLKKYSGESKSSQWLHQISQQFNQHVIFSFLLILTTFSLGLNIADFIKTGTPDILYSSIFIASVIAFFLYMKVEKFIRYSLIYRMLDSIFELKVTNE